MLTLSGKVVDKLESESKGKTYHKLCIMEDGEQFYKIVTVPKDIYDKVEKEEAVVVEVLVFANMKKDKSGAFVNYLRKG